MDETLLGHRIDTAIGKCRRNVAIIDLELVADRRGPFGRSRMERIYGSYELAEEKAAWFLKWEQEIAGIWRRLGIADWGPLARRRYPDAARFGNGYALSFDPQSGSIATGFSRVAGAHVQVARG